MIRRGTWAGLLSALALGACSPTQQQVVIGACQVDGVAQPVFVNAAPIVIGALGATAAPAAPVATVAIAIDGALIHPMLKLACDQVAKTYGAAATPAAAITASVPPK